jgi:hypothetical protein
MTGTAKKERAAENINNRPYTRLNARPHGRGANIPIPAMSPTMPVAKKKQKRERQAGYGDLENVQPR